MSQKDIGADAAKLAGLQIDTLQKVRNGQITLNQLEWFNQLSKDDREKLIREWKERKIVIPVTPVERFSLLADMGLIIVPGDYEHTTQLAKFRSRYKGKFNCHENFTDDNFPNPSRILKSGDKLRVRLFRQNFEGRSTTEERLAFLASQNAIYTGAQGMTLVFEQKRDWLPREGRYLSFDEKSRLWKDSVEFHRLPCIRVEPKGVFSIGLDLFENDSDHSSIILGFFED
jgi:hypothetical protein